jgi:hypothetical protein
VTNMPEEKRAKTAVTTTSAIEFPSIIGAGEGTLGDERGLASLTSVAIRRASV